MLANGQPPNILLLVAEDLSPRIGAYGDKVARTPNLDALAKRSVRFTRVFTTAGVCAPSRAALVMGQHQISFGAQHMRTSTGPHGLYYAQPDAHLKAFPELLRAAGYFTFTDGKLDYQFSGIGAGSGPFTLWDEEGGESHWRNREPGQPFFGLINFLETHESGVMRMDVEPHSESHRGTRLMRINRGLVAKAVTDPADVRVPPYYPDIPEVRADMARHYDNIHAMDARVGKILSMLEQDGLSERTIVIWTTDHGDGLPRAKREILDTGIHVPMLVHVPSSYQEGDWLPGEVRKNLVSFVDIAPTILKWAKVAIPNELHGFNFVTSTREYVFAARDRIDEVPDRQRAIRDERFKYIQSWSPDTPGGHPLAYRDNLEMVRAMRKLYNGGGLNELQSRWFEPPGEEQLYDLPRDPYELRNLADNPVFVEVRKRLHRDLTDWLGRVGDMSVVPEPEMRNKFLAEGEVRVTPQPTVSLQGSALVVQTSEHASAGYRLDGGRWRLFTGPISISAKRVEVKAVRYGWLESPVVTRARSKPGAPSRP